MQIALGIYHAVNSQNALLDFIVICTKSTGQKIKVKQYKRVKRFFCCLNLHKTTHSKIKLNMKLSEGLKKHSYVVTELLPCVQKTQLEAMGFVLDCKVDVLAKSMLNKTLLICIKGSTVAIKKNVLINVLVNECAL